MKERTIYALGFFDGVHLGHQALLRACGELADGQNCRAGVVTFTGHPDALVTGTAPKLINTPADRRLLLQQWGMEKILELPFDRAMMTMAWQDFFRMLVDEFGAGGIVCGQDFRFGSRGLGNAGLLQQACEEQGIPCVVVPEQTLDGITVSSTHIRTLLEQGDLEQAVRFLGHPHRLTGAVVPGRKLGRTMGIPTANLELPQGVLQPRLGAYACQAEVLGRRYLAVTNVGTRPTVGGEQVTVESWLLDFAGDLYGKTLTLLFYAFLRPEKKYPSLEALQEEIQKNAAQTRRLLEKT